MRMKAGEMTRKLGGCYRTQVIHPLSMYNTGPIDIDIGYQQSYVSQAKAFYEPKRELLV